jgi:hypothetical protein
MNKIIETIASQVIDDVDSYIDNTIHWAIDDDAIDYDNKLELKVKQQVLFSLIKRVTK